MKITKGNIIFKGLFMLTNNIVIDGLGGLSLLIHKIFWEIRNFILQTKTNAFYNSINLFIWQFSSVLKFDLHLVAVDPDHMGTQILANAGQDLGVIVVGDGLDHGVGPLLVVATLTNTTPYLLILIKLVSS